MDADLQKLESQLRELKPAPVPPALSDQVVAVFDGRGETAAVAPVVRFPALRTLGAAAALLVAAVGITFTALNTTGSDPDPDPGPVAGDAGPLSTAGKTFVPIRAEKRFRGRPRRRHLPQ